MTLKSLWAVARTAFLKGSPSCCPRSFLIVVSETVIELDDPDGHEPDHPPEMTVPTLGNPVVLIMLAGLVYGRINPRHGNELFVIFELPDITSHLDEKVLTGRNLELSCRG
jgi:hypothetical protein